MTALPETAFVEPDANNIAGIEGRIALPFDTSASLDPLARKVDRLTKGALSRLVKSDAFVKAKPGAGHALAYPAGLAAEALLVVKLPRKPSAAEARAAGSAIANFNGETPLTVLAGGQGRVADLVLGLVLRLYSFDLYRTPAKDAVPPNRSLTIQTRDPAAAQEAFAPLLAQAEGVYFTRDLVTEPANVLTTVEFASRLQGLQDLGVEVEVLEEDELARLGMRTLLAVGEGSESPTKVVVMQWKGAEQDAPLALVGKGVVFDTGGISIKPAAGMEEMTMDMGGAGVVAGVMKTLALRKAKAHVVGLVGIVENMPDGRAVRPGDVVKSMKGDTIEIINTDAEGRLVLADVLWYAQDRFKPKAVVNFATLTGAIIVALGFDNAGLFSNDDDLAGKIAAAAGAEGEGVWRLPLAPAYDQLLKSRIADVANVGSGRSAGAIVAAQFLQRFIEPGTPWAHLDIAGTAYLSQSSELAPKGATGWGVRSIDRLVRDSFEG